MKEAITPIKTEIDRRLFSLATLPTIKGPKRIATTVSKSIML
ncbi:MAG: hypothetical protein QXX92_04685 [Candidatus Bathyarchaeia archaeon]